MYLSHDDPSDIVLESHGQGDMQILTEIAHWLRSFLTHAHPDLGRKGAVCPFMEQSLKLGRTALSSVDISGPRGTERLANTARSALARLGDRSAPDSVYNAFVMVPVGESAEVRRERILEVQQELKAEAVEAGKMVGEFYPGHPMPEIQSETFRPLVSPHPVLAVRAMVVTDILFLTSPRFRRRNGSRICGYGTGCSARGLPGRGPRSPRRPAPRRRGKPVNTLTRNAVGSPRSSTSRRAGCCTPSPHWVSPTACRPGASPWRRSPPPSARTPGACRVSCGRRSLGIFPVDEAGTVRLTPAGTLLRSDQPGSLRAEFSDNDLFTSWGPFAKTVRGGPPSYEIANGTKIFDSMSGDAHALETFHEHMRMRAMQMYRSLLPFLLRRCAEDVVDLAGGTGGLSELLLEGSETLRVTLTDLPEVIGLVPPDLLRRYGHRFSAEAGDMQEGIPQGYGTYLLGSVLHDWPDDESAVILRRCADAMIPGSELILLERVWPIPARTRAAWATCG